MEKRLELVRKISNKINLSSKSIETQPSESSLFCSVDIKSCNFLNKNFRSFKSCLSIFNATLRNSYILSNSYESIKLKKKSASSIRRLTDCTRPCRSIDYLNLEHYTQRYKHCFRIRRAASLPQVCSHFFTTSFNFDNKYIADERLNLIKENYLDFKF